MLPRHAISDADWERLKDLLPSRPGQSGWTPKDNRLLLDAVLWIAKTGESWYDLPEYFGKWNVVRTHLRAAGAPKKPTAAVAKRNGRTARPRVGMTGSAIGIGT